MKRIVLISIALLSFIVTNAQIKIEVKKENVKEAKLEGWYPVKYVFMHPKEFIGVYKQGETNSHNTTEVVVKLNLDGTCTTEWYNSGYVGKPKRSTGSGTWGLMLDEKGEVISVQEEGATWYKIILISDNDKKLPYYDKVCWYDWIVVYPNGDIYLKLVYSTGDKAKKE